MPGYEISVDHTDVDQAVKAATRAITRSVRMLSEQLREEHIPDEAPRGPTGNLRKDWKQRQVDPLTWIVHPGRDAWYAHIVAGGRQTVRPTRRQALTVEDEFAEHVGGTSPNPFDERAMRALDGDVDQVLAKALAMEGVR